MKRGDDPGRKRSKDGRYAVEQLCDGCGKPVTLGEHFTDEDVVGGGDGPGFYLCGRVACKKTRNAKTIEERRAYYKRR